MKFGRVVLRYANGHADKHTDTLLTILRTPTGGEATSSRLVIVFFFQELMVNEERRDQYILDVYTLQEQRTLPVKFNS